MLIFSYTKKNSLLLSNEILMLYLWKYFFHWYCTTKYRRWNLVFYPIDFIMKWLKFLRCKRQPLKWWHKERVAHQLRPYKSHVITCKLNSSFTRRKISFKLKKWKRLHAFCKQNLNNKFQIFNIIHLAHHVNWKISRFKKEKKNERKTKILIIHF